MLLAGDRLENSLDNPTSKPFYFYELYPNRFLSYIIMVSCSLRFMATDRFNLKTLIFHAIMNKSA